MSLETALNYQFKDKNLLRTALTHKSAHHEGSVKSDSLQALEDPLRASLGHNEKLEFLGDAVVDLVISELLMQRFPTDSEGRLSKKRASLVNETTLAEVAERIGISEVMILGKGEILSGGDKKPRLLASTLEALVGAIFLESGYSDAKRSFVCLIEQNLQNLSEDLDFSADFKTRLQEIVQSEGRPAPTYKLILESGPSHERSFEVEVVIKDYPSAKGIGRSKKAAEQMAAQTALQIWQKKETS